MLQVLEKVMFIICAPVNAESASFKKGQQQTASTQQNTPHPPTLKLPRQRLAAIAARLCRNTPSAPALNMSPLKTASSKPAPLPVPIHVTSVGGESTFSKKGQQIYPTPQSRTTAKNTPQQT